ncbi:MAG: hypothetical protein ACTS27_01355, partial [Phycisphaerales bacterium]
RGAHDIGADETPIELHAEDLLERLRGPRETPRASSPVSLRSAAEGRTRPEIIGLFLALLELMKCGVVRVRTIKDDASATTDVVIELKPEITRDPESLSAPAGDLLTRTVNAPDSSSKPSAWDEDDEFAGDDEDDDDDVM